MTSQIDDHAEQPPSEQPSEQPPSDLAHADKYNDPRAKVTRRGVLIGVGVVLLGIAGSALSIWARRTHLERTTAFWGEDVIRAFQLSEELEMIIDPGAGDADTEPVRLSGMPGLGHLRHVLLDDRSYAWGTIENQPVTERIGHSECMMLQFRDPSARRFPDTQIVIDLQGGWLGDAAGLQQVQLKDRFRTALPSYLKRIANYEPIRVERREGERRETQKPGS